MENPWDLIRTRHFHIFPDDEWSVNQHNRKFKNKPERQVQRSLPPLPYAGNPNTARVILLGKNPSYSPADDDDAERLPALVTENEKALTFESDFPFFYLDPQFAGTTGYAWWHQALREAVDACAERGVDAATALSRLACIQQHPYRSVQAFDLQPPSATLDYSLYLIQQAIERGALVVIQYGTANARWWSERVPNLPAECIRLRSAQSGSISCGNMTPGDFARLIDVLTR